MDDRVYAESQNRALKEYEALCRQCGTCCGASGSDPCADLEGLPDGKYRCRSYPARHGVRRTVSGRAFTCVDIRDVLKFGIPYDGCGYGK